MRANRWAWRWSADWWCSQFLTLYITPVIYLYLERLQEWLRGGKGVTMPAPAPELAAQ